MLNYLLNELAYNPPGKEEGYLFWAAWANHAGATVFSTQDAQGPIRHGLVLASCSTLQVLHQLSGPVPQLGTLGALLNPPDQNAVCPTTSQAGSTPRSRARPPDGARAARAQPGEEPLMQKQAPSLPRILVMAGFALSCFGLLLFLWLAFGGPIPLQPKGYRFNVAFREAATLSQEADVRISGVSVGKVKLVTPDKETGASDATIELDSAYAPIPKDTKAILRQKTLLGETYVELTPGSPSAGTVARERPPAGRRGVADRRARRDLPRLRREDARNRSASGCSSWPSPHRAAGATSPTRWATSRPSRRTPPRC